MKLLILIIYFAVMIGIGLYCRKHATDVNGFVLGGRSVGPWLTAFAYGTSYFSAVVFVGYAGQFGWKYGISATWAGIGNAIIGSLLAWVVLGRRTRIMSQHLNSATMPQFFGERFGSSALKIGASVIIFIFLIPYTASLYNGLSRLCTFYVLIIFKACHKGFMLGMFHIQFSSYDCKYFLQELISDNYAVTYQLRCYCNACRTCNCSCSQPVHTKA